MSFAFSRRRRAKRTAALVLLMVLGACGPRQLFATGQAWRRSLCAERPEPEYSRCREAVGRSYDEDRRDRP